MKFTGYIGTEFVTFSIDRIGHLILTHADGTRDQYNEEYYDEDSYDTIRAMLIRDGVRDLHYIESPRRVSIDNGTTWTTPAEALQAVSIETLAEYMDDDAREETAQELAPCTPEEFLTRYLEIAPSDLIVG